MALDKTSVINEFKKHAGDTGSMEVQIALLTKRIKSLADHFSKHKKDHASKRGLLLMVGQRRRYLNYLKRTDEAQYKNLVERLELRK
jgi:small subunit ribosomal protein S15